MFKLRHSACRRFRAPTRFRASSRRFVIGRPTPALEEPEAARSTSSVPLTPVAPNLFAACGIELEEYHQKAKYGSRRKRKSKVKCKRNCKAKGKPKCVCAQPRVRGLQYKIAFWKGVQGKVRERKFTAQTRDADETNDLIWSDQAIWQIHVQLVERTFEEVFSLEQKGSAKIAEIVAWVNRRFDDSPYTFESCCVAAGYNPEELREQFFKRLDQIHHSNFPHYQVLRNGVIDAEHGDPDALEWVLSEADTPMSFVDCCTSLGFNPKKARAELMLPIVNHAIDDGAEDDASDFTFDLTMPQSTAA